MRSRAASWILLLAACTGAPADGPPDPPPGAPPVTAATDSGDAVVWFDQHQAPGTRRMAERLKRISDAIDPESDVYLNDRRVPLFEAKLKEARTMQQRVQRRYWLVEELTFAGRAAEAIEAAGPMLEMAEVLREQGAVANARQLEELVAFAHLRRGEEENCIAAHSVDSCLMPIEGGGVHQLQSGSREAIRIYQRLLGEQPGVLKHIWLLNLAYQTVGEWPEGVPEAHRLPADAFDSEHDLARFPDIAPAVGLNVLGLSGGAVLEDLDRDGDLDVMASAWGPQEQLRYFTNEGDGRFVDRTRAAGLTGLMGGLNLSTADYDNDGWIDVLVLRGAWKQDQGRWPNSLIRNRGDGTFEDVTEAAGMLTEHPTQVGVWADYDDDGWIDLFIGNETTHLDDEHPVELWHNEGDGRFTERAATLLGETVLGRVKGAAWGDYDDDGRADLYVSLMPGRNRLYHNDGPGGAAGWSFTEVGDRAGVTEPYSSFPAWFWDYDNDGRLDLLVGAFRNPRGLGDVAAIYMGLEHEAEVPRLYHNRGDGTFADVTVAAGMDRTSWIMAANFGDLDNDGFLDLYFGTGEPDMRAVMPNMMFRNDAGRRFQDVTTAGGFGHVQKGHGISFADIDNDGDQDIYAVMGGAFSGDVYWNALFLNPGTPGHHWVTLRLEGDATNRAAIGVRVRVRVADTDGSERDVHVVVGTGGSFGASSLQQEIGLGPATAIREIEIRWPTSGTTQRFEAVAMDRVYRVVEGADALEVVAAPAIDLGAAVGHGHRHGG